MRLEVDLIVKMDNYHSLVLYTKKGGKVFYLPFLFYF